MSFIKSIILLINRLNDWVGNIFSTLVYLMIVFLVWEVIMRYIFNQPTIWAHELSAMLYAVFFLLGGAYALRWNAHINVEIIYVRLSLRKRAVLDLATWLFFYLFCIFMLWDGVKFAWASIAVREVSHSVWEPPIWPIKLCIPLGAFLILLQGLVKTISDIFTAATGRELISETEKETER